MGKPWFPHFSLSAVGTGCGRGFPISRCQRGRRLRSRGRRLRAAEATAVPAPLPPEAEPRPRNSHVSYCSTGPPVPELPHLHTLLTGRPCSEAEDFVFFHHFLLLRLHVGTERWSARCPERKFAEKFQGVFEQGGILSCYLEDRHRRREIDVRPPKIVS